MIDSVQDADAQAHAIVSEMRRLRLMGRVSAAELQHEVERVSDWREHVRSRPILAAVAGSAGGFLLVRALARPPQRRFKADQTGSVTDASAASGLMAFAGGIAGAVVKQWLLSYASSHINRMHSRGEADHD